MKEVFRSYPVSDRSEFYVYGRAVNGEAKAIDESITLVGQDVALSLPEYNVAAVYDGAGGATDVGLPELAALQAAMATRSYFQQGGDNLNEAIEQARMAVTSDNEAGVCVGSLVAIGNEEIEVLSVGDTGVFTYDPESKIIPFFMEQQIEFGQPTNYLGRRGLHMPEPKEGIEASLLYAAGSELYVMSDGALGNWLSGTELQPYHLEAAHEDYQLIQYLREEHPGFEHEVRKELSGQKARALRYRQLKDTTNQYGDGGFSSPELSDPELLNLDRLDWDVWLEIVKPLAQKYKTKVNIGKRAMLSSLVDRPITWQHERPRPDDATIIYTKLNK